MIRILVLATLLALSSTAAANDLLPPDRPIPDVIDHYIALKVKQAGVAPAPQADDAALLRRLTLDLAGRIPSAAEARTFIESKDHDKRATLTDRLLASPDFVRHSATEFDTLLQNGSGHAPSLRPYLLTALRENRPWDRMFRELLGVVPDPTRPDQFVLKRLGDLDVLTRDVTSVFFGVNVMCAQCHRHPYVTSITQDYYYGMKGFFARSIEFQGELRERQYALVQYKSRTGEVRTPKLMFLSGAVIDEPKPDGPDINKLIQEESKRIEELRKTFAQARKYPDKPNFSYREQLAEIALRPAERDRLARSIVNRLWYRFHGCGLVMRLDQMHAKNPPNHPELLDWLARDLIAHNYDLRRLVRGLVASLTYSRSSRWDRGEAPSPDLFAVANLRPLTPMQFGLSALLASNPDALAATLAPEARDREIERLEGEARRTFGSLIEQPQDGLQINVSEALRLSNDEAVLRLLGDRLVAQLVKSGDRRRQVETAVWTVLSRPPTDGEVQVLGDYVARHTAGDAERARLAREGRDRREAIERARLRTAQIEKDSADVVNRHRDAAMKSALAQTEQYLATAAEKTGNAEAVAARRGLDANILRHWQAYLGRPVGTHGIPAPQAAEAIRKSLYTAKVNGFGGHKAVNGWGSEATPWFVANPGRESIRVSSLTLPPRSISTHPSQELAAAVAWRSPIAGTVRISGLVADIDPNCGNGVGWSVELLHEGTKRILASGIIDNGKAVSLDPAKLLGLAAVNVKAGDFLSLVVDPRDRDHSCDSTHLEFVIAQTGEKGRKWDLTADVVDSIQAGNPHADGQGNAAVWHFYAIAGGPAPQAPATIPAGSPLAGWAKAGPEERGQIAARVQKLLVGMTPPPKDEADAKLFRELTAPSGPLFAGVDFSATLDAQAKAQLLRWKEELADARRVAAQPLPLAIPEDPAQSALRQMVWALFTGAEFRFNY